MYTYLKFNFLLQPSTLPMNIQLRIINYLPIVLCGVLAFTMPLSAYEAPPSQKLPIVGGENVLFIGNSLTAQLPETLNEFFDDHGENGFNGYRLQIWNQTFETHWRLSRELYDGGEDSLTSYSLFHDTIPDHADGMAVKGGTTLWKEGIYNTPEFIDRGYILAQEAIQMGTPDGEPWDIVVLQGYSAQDTSNTVSYDENSNPIFEGPFLKYGALLIQEVRAVGAEPILYMNWLGNPSNGGGPTDPPDNSYNITFDRLIANYELLSDEMDAPLIPVGKAMRLLSAERKPDSVPVEWLITDGVHGTSSGDALLHYCFAQAFIGKSAPLFQYENTSTGQWSIRKYYVVGEREFRYDMLITPEVDLTMKTVAFEVCTEYGFEAPMPPVTVLDQNLPIAEVGTAYSETLSASKGTPPYSWQITSGTIPAGLSLNASSGELSGTPTNADQYSFTVEVTDADSETDTGVITIRIISATSDIDSSGLLDKFEIEHFGALGQDPSGDPDNDDADNAAEQSAGSDPNQAHSDADGVNDGTEIALGRNPLGFDRAVLDFFDGFERGDALLSASPQLWSLLGTGILEVKDSRLEITTAGGETTNLLQYLVEVFEPSVWSDFHAILAPYADDADAPEIEAVATVALYLTESGDIQVRNGAAWQTLSQALDTTEMHRYSVKQDYLSQTWELWINGTLVTDPPLHFASQRDGPGWFRIIQEESQFSVFDDLVIRRSAPTGLNSVMTYSTWQSGITTWNGEDSSPTGNPNHNNLSNQLEYAFGFTNPVSGTHSYTTGISYDANNGSPTLEYTYRSNREAEDVSFIVESSRNLVNWNPVFPIPSGACHNWCTSCGPERS